MNLSVTRWHRTLVLGSIFLAACGGGGGEPSSSIVIAKLSGDGQAGIVGQTLADSIRVLVTQDNAPLVGATVTWSTTLTEGTLTPATGLTDGNGLASTEWTLGPHAGLHTVTATATMNNPAGASVNFTASAQHDAPSVIVKVVGDNQTGLVNTLLNHVQARVTDQLDNPVEAVQVLWSALGATVEPESDVTDPAGLSTTQVTLGATPGPVTITASVNGLSGSPLTFNATAQAVPTEATVRVGNNLFSSDRNGSTNPAVDTVAIGSTVTWSWTNTGPANHSVESLGSPSFPSSGIKSGNGETYAATFSAAGTYRYDCAVHRSGMTGTLVVR